MYFNSGEKKMANNRVRVVDGLENHCDNVKDYLKEVFRFLADNVKKCLPNQDATLNEYQMTHVMQALEAQAFLDDDTNALLVIQIVTFINSCQMANFGEIEC